MIPEWRLVVKLKNRSALTAYMEFRRLNGTQLARRAGVPRSLIGFLTTTGRSARDTCSRASAEAIETALDCPKGFLFEERVSHVVAARSGQVDAA